MTVLVTGGAGYIGSHTVRALKARGMNVVAYDNLTAGSKQAVKGIPLVIGDIKDGNRLRETLRAYNVQAVVHFAASIEVAESMSNPSKYYDNNIYGTLALLDAMRECNVDKIVFSSSAAVYGIPAEIPVTENCPKAPINVYGRTKFIMEHIIRDFGVYGMRSVAFRYFNACGADESGEIGESHNPESHIIPNIIKALLSNREFKLYGTDYATPDGTCIRDYIHVSDLAEAHCLALDYLQNGGETAAFNLGYGHGYSNREIISAVEKAAGKPVKVIETQRRGGDPDMLVACSDLARSAIGWTPKHDDLADIVESAYKWHKSHPDGFI